MAVNIGPKIGIDGEKEYRKQINDLITQSKTYSAEMKELESSFNSEASAMDKNRKKGELLEKSIKNQEKQVEELEKGLEASKKKYGENSTQTQKWKQAVSNAKTELNKMRSELQKIPKPLSEIGKSMQSAGKKMQSVGAAATKYVTAPIMAIGAASIAAFKEVDDGLDTIAKKTGASGEALEGLETAAKNIATTIPASFEEAGNAVGSVNTKFGLTGKACEELSTQFVKFAKINDQDVSKSIEGTQKVMAAFGVDTKDAGKLLDAMTKTGQKTGVSMDSLQTSMVKNAAALKDMGLDAYNAAGFLGQVETSGADASQVMAGLSKALVNANKSGKTLPQALGEFQTVMNSAASDTEKLNAATELFGKKAGPAIYEACKTGSLSFESLSSSADEYLGSVETTFQSLLDPADQFEVTMNSLKLLGSEVGQSLLTAAAPSIQKVGEKLKDAADRFAALDSNQQEFVIKSAAALAASGPVLSGVGRLTTGLGKAVEKLGELKGGTGILSALASPAGLAIVALGALTGVMVAARDQGLKQNGALQEMLSKTSEATGELNAAIGNIKGTLSDASAAIDDINGKADAADELIEELYDLESQSKKTAAEQARMKMIVDELNSMYPGLALEIDKTTGSLSKGKKEVANYVGEARKLALIEAYNTAAQKSIEAVAEASVALKKAQKAQADGQAYVTQAQADYNAAIAAAPEAMAGQNAILEESTGKWKLVTLDVTNASNAYKEAEGNLIELDTAVTDCTSAVEDAEGEYQMYIDAAEEMAGAQDTAAQSVEDVTQAVEDNTDAVGENAEAVSGWGQKVQEGAGSAVKNLADAVIAWDNLYEASRESIKGQLGLFDEWEQNSEITFADIKKNLQSQITGMNNYATNMQKLSAAAVKSSDPNFKALVKSVAAMGIGAAGEVDALVKAMETDQESFNEYVAMFGSNYQTAIDNVAYVDSYVKNDFQTGIGKGMVAAKKSLDSVFGTGYMQKAARSFGDKIKTAMASSDQFSVNTQQNAQKINTAVNQSGTNLVNTAKTSTDAATTYTTTTINGMKLNPNVQKISVPKTVTQLARETITGSVQNIKGDVSQINGARAAGRDAKATAEAQMSSMSGKVTSVSVSSGALSNVRASISSFLANNPITTWIKAHVNTTKHAAGGFTYKEQLSWLSEGDQPEVVIPLSSAHRSEAMTLYQQTGERLGIATPNRATMSVNSSSDNVRISFDAERLYAACAAGAKQGMENANIKIYVSEREAGRILRGMGVQFA